jgi:DNA-binding MarR family transcriptional regulator
MAKSDRSDYPVPEIYDRPGFQIRRAHQNSVSTFLEKLKPYDLTPPQYGALTVVARWAPISQIGLARSLGFDRSTTALVVDLLVKRKLIVKTPDAEDRRKFALTLTPAGKKLVQACTLEANAVREALLAPFTRQEAAEFLRLLRKFNDAFDGVSKAPPVVSKKQRA